MSLSEKLYPQDFIEEPPKSDWWAHKPSARKVASTIDRWEAGNILCAAIILCDPEVSGLALEWARMVQKRRPLNVDTAVKLERARGPQKPKRGYSDKLPPLRDRVAPDPDKAMDDFFAHMPANARSF